MKIIERGWLEKAWDLVFSSFKQYHTDDCIKLDSLTGLDWNPCWANPNGMDDPYVIYTPQSEPTSLKVAKAQAELLNQELFGGKQIADFRIDRSTNLCWVSVPSRYFGDKNISPSFDPEAFKTKLNERLAEYNDRKVQMATSTSLAVATL